MKDLLTTEDLLLNLNHKIDKIEVKKTKTFKINKKIIYGSIVFIAVLHLVFMALPMISKDLTKNLFGYQYVIAIPKDQEIDGDLSGSVIRLKSLNPNEIEIEDRILVYGLFSNDFYWEVEVIDHDVINQTIEATFDNIIRYTFTYEDIEGEAGNEASFIGVFYYTASTFRGFITMIILHALIIYILHYAMFKDKDKILKDQKDEK